MFKKWINQAKEAKQSNTEIEILAGEKTDFFVDPASTYRANNAPIYAMETEGDFTLSCKVRPSFMETYDAGAIMLYIDDRNWVKLAFESTDLGHASVISVATKDFSDDANGERIDAESTWLKMTRRDRMIGLYYSNDATQWKMVRLFQYPIGNEEKVLVGLAAQSPKGKGSSVVFSDISYTEEGVKDLRKGI